MVDVNSLSLTEQQVISSKVRYDLTNGHAYQEMPAELSGVIDELPKIWRYAESQPVALLGDEFKQAAAKLFGSETLKKHEHVVIAPSASNAINIVATWFKDRRYRVGLLEPVFDNLHQLMRRKEIPVSAIQESDLINLDELDKKITAQNLNALFIVTPNNPTGFQLDAAQFEALCEFCQRKNVALVTDMTFRLFSNQQFDNYQILEETKADYVVIEDTGKTWPTQEMKASLIGSSESIAADIKKIYHEIYLCPNKIALAVLTEIMRRTAEVGFDKILYQPLAERYAEVQAAITGTGLRLVESPNAAPMPVAWINCSRTGMKDVELVAHLAEAGVAVLPGSPFYWNSPDARTDCVRISLLKPKPVLQGGLNALRLALIK